MIVEIMVGDAYGAGFEYANPVYVAKYNNLKKYTRHPKYKGIGRYTDDAQMSLAIAELIVYNIPWTKENIADRFVQAFKRDPRTGYARHFYRFLKTIKDGHELLEKIKPDSDRSGGAMRATPIGLFPTVDEVKQKCTIQAAITHNTEAGIGAAMAAALMSHYFIYNLGPKKDLLDFIKLHVPQVNWVLQTEPIGEKGWEAVQGAFTAIMANQTMADILKASVAFTGDVDTVAAIAMGAACFSNEVEQNLPVKLIEGLENGPFGLTYGREIDGALKIVKDRLGLCRHFLTVD